MVKLPIKGVAQRKLEEALEKLKDQGKLKKKKKNGNDKPNNPKSNRS
jgi:hypothetical protein